MRYGIRNIFNRFSLFIGAILLMCLLSTIGCRAKKDSSRHESYALGSERTERRTDSIRVMEVVEERSERSGSEVEQSFTRVTEFDSTGRVRSIQETWRDRQQGNVASKERTERIVSVEGSETNITAKDTVSVIAQETAKVDTDSRLIQGVEWIWVILSVVLITAVILYIIYNRVK